MNKLIILMFIYRTIILNEIAMKKIYILAITMVFTMAFMNVKGQNWEFIQESNNNKTLKAISFPDSINGWMVRTGYKDFDNNVIRTEDKGDNWSVQSNSVNDYFNDVHFFDQLEGFILGNITLQKTNDGGKTWEEIALPEMDSPRLIKIVFVDSVGYMMGEYGVLLKSVDKGNTWELKNKISGGTTLHSGIDFINKDTGVIVGMAETNQRSFVTRTNDGGETWSERTVSEQLNFALTDVFFVNEYTGYTVGRGGGVFRSDDAGVSWTMMTKIENSTGDYLWADEVYFQNADTGWVAGTIATGSFMEIHRTDDGGITWHRELKTNAAYFKWTIGDMASSKEGTLWICGNRGFTDTDKGDFILKRSPQTDPPVGIIQNSNVSYLNNYPNPFTTGTTIELEVSKQEEIDLKVYSTTGQLIENIFEGTVNAGIHSFNFESSAGGAGLYMSVLKVNGETFTQKMSKSE